MMLKNKILKIKSQKYIIAVVVVLNLNQHSQYSSTHEAMPLLTCNFHASTFKCVKWHL